MRRSELVIDTGLTYMRQSSHTQAIQDGNVLYSDNLVNGDFSELYHANSAASGDDNSAYDPLNRLTSFRRGTLTSSGNNGSTLDTITTANLVSGEPKIRKRGHKPLSQEHAIVRNTQRSATVRL